VVADPAVGALGTAMQEDTPMWMVEVIPTRQRALR
jgi:hypothetical protein